MSAATDLPAVQSFSIPNAGATPPHLRSQHKRREKLSRGFQHQVPEANPQSTAVTNALDAILTPTLATHSGATVLTHLGTTTAGPRIIIPLPAALATVTALTTGNVVPTPSAGASGTAAAPLAPVPSMLIDSEWFFIQAYPVEVRQFFATNCSFDLHPIPGEIIEKTQGFLRLSYQNLEKVGLNIDIAPSFKAKFDQLCKKDSKTNKLLYPYGHSEEVNNGYYILAYTMSTLLWLTGATVPLRNYPEVTYPGVIAASFMNRFVGFYNTLSKILGLPDPKTSRPYLANGSQQLTGDANILNPNVKPPAITNIPYNTTLLKIAAEYASGRKVLDPGGGSSTVEYEALRDAAMNVIGLDDKTIKDTINLEVDDKNPLKQKITDARMIYFLGLIKGTINPGDVSAAVP